ncbi:hypothetical protein [Ligilactobacillus agilis]|uniref:hypothetical protein n=1 Tax=Ligilactobacillus agilis TaxID=1601 RepID=UPI0015599CF3|nr:hypothetical protein [Ligilactobacillus agilis]
MILFWVEFLVTMGIIPSNSFTKKTKAIGNSKGELSAENTARQALNTYFTKQIVSDEFTA